jgi:preprotein translocase subunit SecD
MKLNWKIWLLIICILGSLLAIFPLDFSKGVKVISVETNSTAYEQGLRQGHIITAVNGEPVSSLEDYGRVIEDLLPSEERIKLIIETRSEEFILFTNQTPEIVVRDLDKTRIKTGLDLSGGARALVTAEEKDLSAKELSDLIAVTSERLDVYGLRDVQIRPVSDLSGKNHMLIEIAGSTPRELEELVAKQGKFEARIGNETVFVGGNQDITYVARTGQQSGIYSCSGSGGREVCNFRFAISLSEEAAERHAEITDKLGTNASLPQYLDKKLDLYLDDKLVNSLYISKDLKGSKTTQIAISGSGAGATREDAYDNAVGEMKQLQTVLITGSLPFKLKVEKLDTISPLLGEQFITTILIAGIAAILAVGVMIFIRYRNIKLSLAVLITSLSEVIIILGISALFSRNLDLPAIAGIIAAIGTGVDSQVIILDESRVSSLSLKERIKRALFIILGTYVTTLFALIPLMWAGAGLLKGFAIITIIGISVGVFITRPAFSEIVKRIVKE